MLSTTEKIEPLIACSSSLDLDMEFDIVISSIGILEYDILIPIVALDMYSFHIFIIPSNNDLLEAMIKKRL
jgi:hypothetical protein